MTQKGFTLIELLVVIAIVAVLAIVVFITLNPILLLQQARDSNRIADAETLNKAIALYTTDVGGSIGIASTTYLSIPDANATTTAGDQCQGVASTTLFSIASGWSYHCAATSTYRATDGTGWVPVNFNAISSGAPFGALPKDAYNSAASLTGTGYYTYATDGSTGWAIALPLESTKYLKQSAAVDGGYDPGLYEIGSKLSLVGQEEGLMAWWLLGDAGTNLMDSSGNGNTATASGTSVVAGKVGNGRRFSSSGDIAYTNGVLSYPSSMVSVAFWGNITSFVGVANRVIVESSQNFNTNSGTYYIFDNRSGGICNPATIAFGYNGKSTPTYSAFPEPSAATWHHFTFEFNSQVAPQTVQAYLDGQAQNPTLCQQGFFSATNTIVSQPIYLMSRYLTTSTNETGNMNDLRIYSTILNALQVQNMYNAMN